MSLHERITVYNSSGWFQYTQGTLLRDSCTAATLIVDALPQSLSTEFHLTSRFEAGSFRNWCEDSLAIFRDADLALADVVNPAGDGQLARSHRRRNGGMRLEVL